jgi:NAD(P)-dependent dehydrogenase (short-subunit alcohol dehydrogenase family)
MTELPPARRSLVRAALAAGFGTALAAPAAAQAPAAGRFAGKVVVITGATSGIGRATAEAFAREGAAVVFNGRRAALGREVEAGIRAAGGAATYVQGDVRREADVRALVEAALARHGRIDAVFANAGTDKRPAPIAETDTEEFDDLIATNLRGVFLTMKHALPHLVRFKGALVSMASIGGRHAFRNIVGYGASKAAVIHMTRAAAQEYGRDVRINAIAPGAIETPMLARVREQWGVTNEQLVAPYPMQRVGRPEEVAELVLWLASDANGYVSGQVVGIDGGDLS